MKRSREEARAAEAARVANENLWHARRYAAGLLGEEGCEIGQISGKAARFGLLATRRDGSTFADLYHEEIGDLFAAADYAAEAGLIDMGKVQERRKRKFAKLVDPKSFTHEGQRLAPPLPGRP